jgi:hypothetical protein
MNRNTLPTHPTLVHPHTNEPLQAVWVRPDGRPVWPVIGASEGVPETGGQGGAGGAAGAGQGSGQGNGQGSGPGAQNGAQGGDQGGGAGQGNGNTDKGFPAGTPVNEMTVDQQAAYWKHQSRNWENKAKSHNDYDQVKTELEQLRTAQMSDADKAIADARAEAEKAGRAAAQRELGSKIVDAHVQAAVTAERITKDQAETILEGLDRTKYLTETGDVDTDKLAAYLAVVAPAKKSGKADHGQGNRGENNQPSGRDAGKAEAARRFGNRTTGAAAGQKQ